MRTFEYKTVIWNRPETWKGTKVNNSPTFLELVNDLGKSGWILVNWESLGVPDIQRELLLIRETTS